MGDRKTTGFTIVELLVVIVVIGILAAVSLIAYSGVSRRAIVATMQNDLSNASTRLKMFQAEYNTYPGSILDCPNPSQGNLCLKTSPGNSFSYSVNNSASPPTYSLSIINNDNIYQITSESQTPTTLASAPFNPTADWLAISTGDHYGNFYDLISHNYANVTRAGTKTIYDPNTQRIHDVPANTLGVRPRSDGKSGLEAEIEEGRTNTTLYSSLETDSDSDGRADGIGGPWGPGIVSHTRRQVSGGVYGNKYQQFTDIVASSSTVFQIYTNAYTGFSSGESATCSAYVSGNSTGVSFIIGTRAYQDNTSIGEVNASVVLSNKFTRIEKTYTSLPANTNKVMCLYQFNSVDPGDSPTMNLDALQLEKGAFATSYIPTTGISVTRSADVVTIPTDNWNADNLTFLFTHYSPPDTGVRRLLKWNGTNGDYNTFYTGFGTYGNPTLYQTRSDGAFYKASTMTAPASYHTSAGTLVASGYIRGYFDGVYSGSQASSSVNLMRSPQSTAYLGCDNTTYAYSAPIQRFIVYPTVLSDTDVTTASNYIKDGP